MNPFLQTSKKPFAATGLGVAVNTVLGLPQAALGVTKDIGQSIVRSAGSAGLTFAKPLGGVEQLQPSDIKSPYAQGLYKSLFGTKPLKAIEDNIVQAEIAIKQNPFAQKLGLDKIALPLAFGGVYGGDLLDLVPLGGLEKNAVKALVKETTTEGALKILQVMKVPEDIAIKFTPHFAEATTPQEVQSVLDTMKGVLGVKGVEAVNASKGVVPGDAKATLANIQEKLGVRPVEALVAPKSARTALITPKVENIPQITKTPLNIHQELDNAKLKLSFIQDAMQGHHGQGAGKFLNWRTGEFTKGADVKFQNAVGQDVSMGGDINALEKFSTEYKSLQAQETEVKQYIKNLSAEAKSIPKSALPEGEVKSLEALANQELQKLDVLDRAGVPSLKDIVSKTPTDVKTKVNIIDYMRTPDRILEKIGFGNESKMLRQGYEKYIKELPKNIDKVTAWSKEVPEAGKTIFQYLDGENVALTDTERKVAGEIKGWLAEWAKRLNLPEDKTITNYITHIFDKELVAKEFDENLAKIITDKIPGSVYDPFLETRLGARGYKQNVWEALDAYVKRATRKVNMDEALKAIQSKAGSSLERAKIEASQFKYLQRYTSHINLRPTELDNILDNTIKSFVGYKYGQRPITYLTSLLRRMTYRGMLGLNPGSALRNISQGINTYAVLGEKYTTIGYVKLFSKGAMQELADEGIMSPGFIQDRLLSSSKKAMEKIDKGLFAFFDGAEKVNRGSAYFGAKSKALAEGETPQEAIDYAKYIVRKTQFSFGSIDTPVGLQSDIIKTLFQFQNYTLKQIEFLVEMSKDKNFVGLLRYGVAGLIFTATIGKAFGMNISNLIPSFRFGTPPSLKLPTEITKAVLNVPDKYGQPVDLKQKISNVLDSAVGLIPTGTQIKKSLQGLKAFNQGKDVTATGKTRFTIPKTPSNLLRSSLFGKSSLPQAKEYYSNFGKKKSNTNPFLK